MMSTDQTTAFDYQSAGRDHLWLHFTRHSTYEDGGEMPLIVRGEGHRIWDSHGREYIDGLAGLFVVQVGHGREELAEAAARQMRELSYFPLWSAAHPRAIELAERLVAEAPGDLNRVFFTVSGGESVETAWKLAKNYFKLTGRPTKHKVISRSLAYHGTSQGALSITGLPALTTADVPSANSGSAQMLPSPGHAAAPWHTSLKRTVLVAS